MSVDVLKKNVSNTSLEQEIGVQTSEPHHALNNPPSAPFIFSDSRHVFYITTKVTTELPPKHNGYGFSRSKHDGFNFLPPILYDLKSRRVPPKEGTDWNQAVAESALVSSGALHSFVSEDAYIIRAIDTTAIVPFGEKQIGPAGALDDAQPQ